MLCFHCHFKLGFLFVCFATLGFKTTPPASPMMWCRPQGLGAFRFDRCLLNSRAQSLLLSSESMTINSKQVPRLRDDIALYTRSRNFIWDNIEVLTCALQAFGTHGSQRNRSLFVFVFLLTFSPPLDISQSSLNGGCISVFFFNHTKLSLTAASMLMWMELTFVMLLGDKWESQRIKWALVLDKGKGEGCSRPPTLGGIGPPLRAEGVCGSPGTKIFLPGILCWKTYAFIIFFCFLSFFLKRVIWKRNSGALLKSPPQISSILCHVSSSGRGRGSTQPLLSGEGFRPSPLIPLGAKSFLPAPEYTKYLPADGDVVMIPKLFPELEVVFFALNIFSLSWSSEKSEIYPLFCSFDRGPGFFPSLWDMPKTLLLGVFLFFVASLNLQ